MNKFDLKNRISIVTGGAQGFGLAIAKKFLECGAEVIIWDIDKEVIKETEKNINNKKFTTQIVDITNFKEVTKNIELITSEKNIDIFTMRHPDGTQTKEEKDWETKFKKDQLMQEGYRTQQATKPQTLSYGMMDSPVGVAAWIIEKFYFWSDLKNNDIESVYSKDILLANIMVYIVTNTFNTASWIYYGRREEGGRFLPKNFHRIEAPTAAALFPAEMLAWPPRSYAERMYNIKRWTKMSKGGHFAALEQPTLLINDIRAFARTLR